MSLMNKMRPYKEYKEKPLNLKLKEILIVFI